ADVYADEGDRYAPPGKLRRLETDRLLSDAPLDRGEDGELSSTAAGRVAMVPHSPLPPRPGVTPAEITEAPADQLLAAAWRRLGGTTFWDQAKTVLALVGVLTLVIQFWRLNRHPDVVPEAD